MFMHSGGYLRSLNIICPRFTVTLMILKSVTSLAINFLLSYPRFKSKATLGDGSFTCAAPKLWNALPHLTFEAPTRLVFLKPSQNSPFPSCIFIIVVVILVSLLLIVILAF